MSKYVRDKSHSKFDLLNNIYPVGSIYMSINETNPSELFGGTWEQIKDTFLLSAGDTYTAGSTGGEATHVLTVDEMPSHKHGIYVDKGTKYGSWGFTINRELSDRIDSACMEATGDNQAHNNMPPYLTVYMWKRTA